MRRLVFLFVLILLFNLSSVKGQYCDANGDLMISPADIAIDTQVDVDGNYILDGATFDRYTYKCIKNCEGSVATMSAPTNRLSNNFIIWCNNIGSSCTDNPDSYINTYESSTKTSAFEGSNIPASTELNPELVQISPKYSLADTQYSGWVEITPQNIDNYPNTQVGWYADPKTGATLSPQSMFDNIRISAGYSGWREITTQEEATRLGAQVGWYVGPDGATLSPQSIISNHIIDVKAKKEEELKRQQEAQVFLSRGLNIPLEFGAAAGAIGDLLGPDEWKEGWQDMFPDWFAGLTGIDGFINYGLCAIPTDEDQVSTSVFFDNGDIGAHIEGYRIPFNSTVSCEGDEECKGWFSRNEFICFEGVCANSMRQPQVLKTNIYRITLMFWPAGAVVNEGESVEFDVLLYPKDGAPKVLDINGDGNLSNDRVKLSSGSETYQLAGDSQIVFLNTTEYEKVCMKFKNTDVFTVDFKRLLREVGDESALCNSFVNEGHEGTDISGLASFFSFGAAGGPGIAETELPAQPQTSNSTNSQPANGDNRPMPNR